MRRRARLAPRIVPGGAQRREIPAAAAQRLDQIAVVIVQVAALRQRRRRHAAFHCRDHLLLIHRRARLVQPCQLNTRQRQRQKTRLVDRRRCLQPPASAISPAYTPDRPRYRFSMAR